MKGMRKLIEFFDVLKHLSDREETFIIGLYTLILMANFMDVLFGWLNGRFNPQVKFKSEKALYGIIRKMMNFIVLVFFMIVAYVVVDSTIAFTSIVSLTSVYLYSELISVLAHLGIVDDDKENIFSDFLKEIFKRDGEK